MIVLRFHVSSTVKAIPFMAFAAWFLTAADVSAQSPEYRAMWVSRFEWPNADEATCRSKIESVMQTLAANNFNAVFFQVRGQCDVLYPSPYEVWSPLIGGADPGWDPLAYAIDRAHLYGLEFHAYINTHTCWLNSSQTPPANPNHLFFQHCNAADPAKRDWLIHGPAGNPVQWSENGYVWLAPGVPAYQAYLRKQVMYVVQNYDIDGVHFDRIRTPNSSYSYDPISQYRRASAQTNPNNLDFSYWTRDQITRMVRDLYASIMSVKPQVKVSAAVFSDPATSPASVHQDSLVWAQTGGMDILMPMMYFTGGEGSTWDTRLQQWLAGSAGRLVIAGQSTSEGEAALLEQIALTRTRGAAGNCAFSYNSFTFWNSYLTNYYQVPAALPAMSWKTSPTDGIIHGYVTDVNGSPVSDAQVVRSGSTYVGLTSGDGYYSFLQVPQGNRHSLTVSHSGYSPVTVTGVAVTDGTVVRRDIQLGSLLPPVIAPVTPDPDSAVVGTEYHQQLTLASGTAESWTLLDGPYGATVDTWGAIRGWKPRLADIGAVNFTVRCTNAAGSDDVSWQVLVEPAPSCDRFLLTGFDSYANGTRVLFQYPRYSGTTINHLATTPNVAQVTNSVPGYAGSSKCYQVQWQFVDATSQRWFRLTTSGTANIPNPVVEIRRPIRLRLRLDSGSLRLAVGLREVTTTGELGSNGGTNGVIEWVGATSVVNSAPQGVLVQGKPGVWQTFTFYPSVGPVQPFTGDGILWSSNGKVTLEELAISCVDTAGPFTLYLDEVELLCPSAADFNSDNHVDAMDFDVFSGCYNGPTNQVLGDCLDADLNGDRLVDAVDFDIFSACYNGPVNPPRQ